VLRTKKTRLLNKVSNTASFEIDPHCPRES
jgi:hypothetical protein